MLGTTIGKTQKPSGVFSQPYEKLRASLPAGAIYGSFDDHDFGKEGETPLSFLRKCHFILKIIILPRQARDKT
jgi:hypothetical protein